MKAFFSDNGTQSEYFWANQEATSLWIEKLKNESESRDDTEPLKELIPWMLQKLAKDRPTAQQVVNCILNFETRHAFYGMCCGNDDVTVESTYDDLPPSYTEGNIDDPLERLNYFSPSCKTITNEEITRRLTGPEQAEDSSSNESTIRNTSYPAENSEVHLTIRNEADDVNKSCKTPVLNQEERLLPSEIFTRGDKAHGRGPSFLELKERFVLSVLWAPTKLILSSAMSSVLYCQWLACPSNLNRQPLNTKEALHKHYRSAHETHDYSWSNLLDDDHHDSSAQDTRLINVATAIKTAVLVSQNYKKTPTQPSYDSLSSEKANSTRSAKPAVAHKQTFEAPTTSLGAETSSRN
jgi:hypothetical protein